MRERTKFKSVDPNRGMPLLFLITELVRINYFDSIPNSILFFLSKILNFLRLTIMDSSKMISPKEDITFKKM